MHQKKCQDSVDILKFPSMILSNIYRGEIMKPLIVVLMLAMFSSSFLAAPEDCIAMSNDLDFLESSINLQATNIDLFYVVHEGSYSSWSDAERALHDGMVANLDATITLHNTIENHFLNSCVYQAM
jgi:hypothetical protein